MELRLVHEIYLHIWNASTPFILTGIIILRLNTLTSLTTILQNLCFGEKAASLLTETQN